MLPSFVRSVYCLLLYMAVCSPASAQEGQKPALVTAPEVEPGRDELKNLVIKNVRLFAWQEVYKKRKYVEVLEFRETQGLHLIPSNKFDVRRSEEHTSELQSRGHLVCRLLLEKKKCKLHGIECFGVREMREDSALYNNTCRGQAV